MSVNIAKHISESFLQAAKTAIPRTKKKSLNKLKTNQEIKDLIRERNKLKRTFSKSQQKN